MAIKYGTHGHYDFSNKSCIIIVSKFQVCPRYSMPIIFTNDLRIKTEPENGLALNFPQLSQSIPTYKMRDITDYVSYQFCGDAKTWWRYFVACRPKGSLTEVER